MWTKECEKIVSQYSNFIRIRIMVFVFAGSSFIIKPGEKQYGHRTEEKKTQESKTHSTPEFSMGLETDNPVFSTTMPKRCEVFSSLLRFD